MSFAIISRLLNPLRVHQLPLSHLQFIFKIHTFSHQNPNCIEPINPNPTQLNFNYTTVSETLTSYCNDHKRALEFFNWVQESSNFEHNTETFNRMIDILGKFFEFEKSWELIETMRKRELSMPDRTTFRIMFKRYVSAHLVNEAIDVYENRIDGFGFKDEVSFFDLMDALCEYKHVVEAQELWVKRKESVGFRDETKVYNMMLRGWSKLGWWGKCREFWEEMDRKGVAKDVVSYSIYMDIQCKCNKPWKAVKLYKEMKRKRIRLDVVAYNTAVRAIGLSEGVDFSVRLYKEMMELGCKPNVATYNVITKLFCDNGRMKEARDVIREMRKRGCQPNVITYNCFFRSLVEPKKILRLFEEMIDGGLRPGLDTYVMLLRKFGNWGFLRPAFIVWDTMQRFGCSPDVSAYNALIDVLVQKGMIDMAKKYDQEMLAKELAAKPRVELGTKEASRDSGDVYL